MNTGEAMAISNFITNTSPMILASKRLSSRPERSYYTTPISSFTLPLIRAVEPISTLVKVNSVFGGNTNTVVFFGSNSILFLNRLTQLKCHGTKTDAVADPEEEKQSKRNKMDRSRRFWSRFYAIVIGASICVFLGICALKLPNFIRPSSCIYVPYSDLVGEIQDGNVIQVQFEENSRQIYFNTNSLGDPNVDTQQTNLLTRRLKEATKTFSSKWQYETRNVDDDRYELFKLLKKKGITYGSNRAILPQSMKKYLYIFFEVAPFWIMVLISLYQINDIHDLGKIIKRKPSKKPSVTFENVKGVDDAKMELLEILLCMKGDNRYKKLGAKVPRGVLLTGPPGTGKTLLARAVAGEAEVAFFSISASELVEIFVGRGAARVRDLFREARKNSPSMIFIDEIDAVGGQRGIAFNCEHDQTLNQLLTEMDGFEKKSDVVVIAATNRPEALDAALMRPSRFSRKVRVDVPNKNGRRAIFSLYIKDVPINDDKEAICDLVASLTNGLVGADLENIAHESVLLAARRGGEFVTMDDVLQAVERARMKIYENVPETNTPTTRDFMQGGSLGFGISY